MSTRTTIDDYDQIAKRFGAEMRRARRAEGISMMALAEEMGWGYSAIWNYEVGNHLPATDHLVAIARRFGLSLDELLLGGK